MHFSVAMLIVCLGSSAKMRLIFLDLIFIVFNSANLALAFESIFDGTWACQAIKSDDPNAEPVCDMAPFLCHKQKALSGTLVVALVAWLVTFAISTLRYACTQLSQLFLWQKSAASLQKCFACFQAC
jgi:hypothetical protein